MVLPAKGWVGRSEGGFLPEIRSNLKEELRRHTLDIVENIAIYRNLCSDVKGTCAELSETVNGL
jgi:hypothetical protein